jgi:hypothetical protein
MLLGPVTRALGSLGFIIGFCFSEPGFFIFRTQQFCGWSVRKEPKCGMIATQATQFRSLKLYKFPEMPQVCVTRSSSVFLQIWSTLVHGKARAFQSFQGDFHWDLPLGFTIGFHCII